MSKPTDSHQNSGRIEQLVIDDRLRSLATNVAEAVMRECNNPQEAAAVLMFLLHMLCEEYDIDVQVLNLKMPTQKIQ